MRQSRQWFGAAVLVAAAAGLAVSSSALAQTEAKKNRQAPVSKAPATSQLCVVLQPDASAQNFAARYGFRLVQSLRSLPNAWVVETGGPQVASMAVGGLRGDPAVQQVFLNGLSQNKLTVFAPNDPYYPKDSPVAGWNGQWHLKNGTTAGLDVAITDAWSRDYTGLGVLVGVVDQGVEYTHPDLAPNYSATHSFNFVEYNADPAPGPTEWHSTAVSGLIAARGGNGIGVTGVAPYATFAGLRVGFDGASTAMSFADADMYHSYGLNTSIKIKNHSYGIPAPFIDNSLEYFALGLSAGAGTIHAVSAGNERGTTSEDENKKQVEASPDVITVAALGVDGKFAYFSSYGASVFVTAPGRQLLTTDRTGTNGYNTTYDTFPDTDYTAAFGGTSGSSPIVAGVLATVKQAQPLLNSRFAKHLLARTSAVVDASDATTSSDGGWKTNAAGLKFNQNYGFGLPQADKLAQMAIKYQGVTPLVTESTGTVEVGQVIPDDDPTGISIPFEITSSTSLEEVLVTLTASHSFRGDLTAWLTSPAGTTTRLFVNDVRDNASNLNWTFGANAFWGENPQGTWTLKVADVQAGDEGALLSFSATARMGNLVPGLTVAVADSTVKLEGATTLTATVTKTVDGSAYQPPAGVAFYVGGALVGTANADATGKATISYTAPTASAMGIATIRAQVAANGVWKATHGTGFLTVTPGNSWLYVAPKTKAIGDRINLTAQLYATVSNAKLVGRTVEILVDGVSQGTATTLDTPNQGMAIIPFTVTEAIGVGAHTITANFAGDARYLACTGTGALTVTKGVALVQGFDVSTDPGTAVTLKGVLYRIDGFLVGKTITFKVDGVAVGSGTTNASGSATYSYTPAAGLAPGSHVLTTEFAGDATSLAATATNTLILREPSTLYVSDRTVEIYNKPNLGAQLKGSITNRALIGKTLTFKLDGVSIGSAVTTATPVNGGAFIMAYPIADTLAVGPHTLSVAFAGDSEAKASTGSGTITVTKATAFLDGTTISTDPNTTVTLTGVLYSYGGYGVGKTLRFKVDGTVVGTGTTNASGKATFSYAVGSTPGVKTVRVEFDGDAILKPVSVEKTLTVKTYASNLTVGSTSGRIGEGVSLTATLKRTLGSLAVSGATVTFSVGGAAAGSATTDATGVATLAYTIPGSAVAGTQTIGAAFAGDAVLSASTGSGTLTVDKATTSQATASLSGQYGDTVTLSTTLTRTVGAVALASKSITFKIDGAVAGTGTTDASGVATASFTIPLTLAAGDRTITAEFAGDPDNLASTGTGTLTVTKLSTTASVQNVAGQKTSSVTLQGLLKRTGSGQVLTNQTLEFWVDLDGPGAGAATKVGQATTGGTGIASLSYTIPATAYTGAMTLYVVYAGDANNAASQSPNGTLTARKADTTTTANSNSTPRNTPVALTGTLKRNHDNAGVVGVTVRVLLDGTQIGTTTTGASGSISYTYGGTASTGTHTFTFVYDGDDTYFGSQAAATLLIGVA